MWRLTVLQVLFSMPTALPVTAVTMNYSSVVLVGFGAIAAVWFLVHSRKGRLWFLRNLFDSFD